MKTTLYIRLRPFPQGPNQRCPAAAEYLQRKKDVGRSDALLIALYGSETEAIGPAKAAA